MPKEVRLHACVGIQGGLPISAFVSYPADKIPSHFRGGFRQRPSVLSSTGRISLCAAGCLLGVSLERPYREFLKGR